MGDSSSLAPRELPAFPGSVLSCSAGGQVREPSGLRGVSRAGERPMEPRRCCRRSPWCAAASCLMTGSPVSLRHKLLLENEGVKCVLIKVPQDFLSDTEWHPETPFSYPPHPGPASSFSSGVAMDPPNRRAAGLRRPARPPAVPLGWAWSTRLSLPRASVASLVKQQRGATCSPRPREL